MKNSLMWFRYDLRIEDNEALFAALDNQVCLPVFILDQGLNHTPQILCQILIEAIAAVSARNT